MSRCGQPPSSSPAPGEVLWEPSADRMARAEITRYREWLALERGLRFASYQEMHAWSVSELDGFWGSLREFFELEDLGRGPALASEAMPGAVWFPEARMNYAQRLLAGADAASAVLAVREDGRRERLTYAELRARVAAARQGLAELGVRRGDRVAAVLPTGAHALVAMLATASLGAVWSSCSPDYGTRSIADRFAQVQPAVLIGVDGYLYNGRAFDTRPLVAELAGLLPSVAATVLLDDLVPGTRMAGTVPWSRLEPPGAQLAFEPVAFDHPLWILYSSGTTGLPKAIVQGHGGIVLEHLKAIRLHLGMTAEDRLMWFTTTAWMMWNYLAGGLLSGGSIVLYDGSPGHPSRDALWEIAARERVTIFGSGAPFLAAAQRAGSRPRDQHDLSAIHTIGSTASPLAPEAFVWAAESIGDDVLVGSMSGGTDVCSGFVGSCPILPVRVGEIQCKLLGCAVEAFDEAGRSVVGQPGELVVTRPMPSMPLRLWNDPGDARYRDAYFARYPGVWCHGDVVTFTSAGGSVISGRSDATLNRGGVRMGTAEFYRVLESDPAIADSLVVETDGQLLVFVALSPGAPFQPDSVRRLLRTHLTPRHVPDEIIAVPAIPRTATGKKLEVPVRRLLSGTPRDEAVQTGALADPGSLEPFLALAAQRRRGGETTRDPTD